MTMNVPPRVGHVATRRGLAAVMEVPSELPLSLVKRETILRGLTCSGELANAELLLRVWCHLVIGAAGKGM